MSSNELQTAIFAATYAQAVAIVGEIDRGKTLEQLRASSMRLVNSLGPAVPEQIVDELEKISGVRYER